MNNKQLESTSDKLLDALHEFVGTQFGEILFTEYLSPDEPLEGLIGDSRPLLKDAFIKILTAKPSYNMQRLIRIREAREILKENLDDSAYAMSTQIGCISGLTDEEHAHLLDLGLQVYQEYEIATPTGVGCAIGSMLRWGQDWDDPTQEPIKDNLTDYTYEEVLREWECGDRT